MSDTNCSVCNCPDPLISLVPGVEGEAGSNGAAGLNAFSISTSAFTVPAIGATVQIFVVDSQFLTVGQNAFVEGAGYFEVISKAGTTSFVGEYLDYSDNTAAGNIIAAGAAVSPGGSQITTPVVVADGGTGLTTLTAFGVLVGNGAGNVAVTAQGAAGTFLRGNGAANPTFDALTLPTAFTDNTTGTPSNTLAAGVGVFTLAFPIQLAAMTTAAADLLTNYVLGFAFKILSVSFSTTTIGAGAGASQVLNLEIGAVNVTGGVVTLTEAGTDTLGELTAGTAVTAANVGTAADTLSIEVAAGGTVFSAGAGVLLVQVMNMDLANAIASLAEHTDDLITELS